MSHSFMSASPPGDTPTHDLTEKEEEIIRAMLPIISELHIEKDILIVQGLKQLLVRLRD